ncbi:AraC-type DNA-binding protein [Streptacidiphilus jiangxiensis]|uniref:AraC-type DNA-binding protein n=1 Tax=Streptacidiphilus jiangxiensis TaxID=235985 RepID=A0A1H7SL19_STRJI|nr:AraC-type DNA-binding protein [Streptacidiphilus jiangxiensis]
MVSDAIRAVQIGRPSSNRVRVGGSWCTRLAPYDGAGFHVVLTGGCRLLTEDGGTVVLGPGDAVLLPHGAGHVLADVDADPAQTRHAVPFEAWAEGRVPRVQRPGPGEVELLCGKYRLDRSRVHPLLAELPQVIHLPNRVGSHPELRAAIDLLGRELDERRPGACIALPSLLDLLLVYMIRARLDEGASGAWPAVLADPVTSAALRALHTDPAAPWTNERLAEEVGVSRPTLARRFSALVGRPPMAYLTWWRLTLAAELLRGTTDPLGGVARRVGYGTPYALSHAFQREFGVTPGRYRALSAPAAAAATEGPVAAAAAAGAAGGARPSA